MSSPLLRSETLVARRASRSSPLRLIPGVGVLYVVTMRHDAPPMGLLVDLGRMNDGASLRDCARLLIEHVALNALNPSGFNAAETGWLGYDSSGRFFELSVQYSRRGAPTGIIWDPVVPSKVGMRVGGRRAVIDVHGATAALLIGFAARWRQSLLETRVEVSGE